MHRLTFNLRADPKAARSGSDINRDGRTDLLFEGADPDHWLAVWYMKQNKKVESLFLDPDWISDSYKIVGVADFNGDSKLDILFQNANGVAVLWFMDGARQTGSASLSPQPLSSQRIVGTGDFDHDGKTDILFQVNHPPPPDWDDHRALFVWFMDGATRKPTSPVMFLNPYRPTDAAWTYAATGDFDNPVDGYPDILFQRRETDPDGSQKVRLMYWFLMDYPGTSYGIQVREAVVGGDQSRKLWNGLDIVGPR